MCPPSEVVGQKEQGLRPHEERAGDGGCQADVEPRPPLALPRAADEAWPGIARRRARADWRHGGAQERGELQVVDHDVIPSRASSALSIRVARKTRDLTVPIGTSSASAMSAYRLLFDERQRGHGGQPRRQAAERHAKRVAQVVRNGSTHRLGSSVGSRPDRARRGREVKLVKRGVGRNPPHPGAETSRGVEPGAAAVRRTEGVDQGILRRRGVASDAENPAR